MSTNNIQVQRPWGGFTILSNTKYHWIKKLFIKKQARFSLQTHQNRSEIWFVLKGVISAEIGETKRIAKKGSLLFVPKKTKHRILGIEEACILEIAFGKNVDENDITRHEDDYGRV